MEGYFEIQNSTLKLRGEWILANASELARLAEPSAAARVQMVDGSAITKFDTTGAGFLLALLSFRADVKFTGFDRHFSDVLHLVQDRYKPYEADKAEPLPLIARIGSWGVHAGEGIYRALAFLGQALDALGEQFFLPHHWRVRELFVQLEQVCLRAIMVVALMTFLVGVVVAYLLSMQLQKYGGYIFVADGVAMAMWRELSPLIVAVIMAGRSGSAFTAQIGAMKINEEVDAMVTLGLSPMQVLVLPRVIALVVAMPLLVFIGDVVGTLGGAFVANSYLGVTLTSFTDRLQFAVPVRHLMVGFGKAPVFAFFIGLIGCYRGLMVENNAQSVGLNTTATVVHSIVCVIILNAIFAVTLAQFGW